MNMSTNKLTDLNPPQSDSGIAKFTSLISRKVRIVAFIILIAIVLIMLLVAFKPEAEKRAIPETVVRVDVVSAQRSSYPILVNANGTIEAETRGDLVAQIRGEIVAMADNFKTGGTFKKGDELIQIDQRDYRAAMSQARAALSQAEVAYRQEQANAKQAKQDWERLGNTTPAPALVLRKPQLTAAKAQFDSASAAHDTAKLNLSRTTITAPYDGRIIRRNAVLGQYVGVGSPIAEVFATQGVEVRLPISQEEFNQLGLDQFTPGGENDFIVSLSSTIGNQNYRWDAQITRTDSTFDINTRQIDVIASVEDPFGKLSGQPQLKIGQFVTAQISGRTVDDVFVIPNKSIREGSYLYVVRDQKLAKQPIKILWQDDQNALIANGIENEELIVTTSLNSTLAGARAKLSDEVTARIEANKQTTVNNQASASDQVESAVEIAQPLDPNTEGTSQPPAASVDSSATKIETSE
jgi:RND family efflux transporter MFP subunit